MFIKIFKCYFIFVNYILLLVIIKKTFADNIKSEIPGKLKWPSRATDSNLFYSINI